MSGQVIIGTDAELMATLPRDVVLDLVDHELRRLLRCRFYPDWAARVDHQLDLRILAVQNP